MSNRNNSSPPDHLIANLFLPGIKLLSKSLIPSCIKSVNILTGLNQIDSRLLAIRIQSLVQRSQKSLHNKLYRKIKELSLLMTISVFKNERLILKGIILGSHQSNCQINSRQNLKGILNLLLQSSKICNSKSTKYNHSTRL